MSDLRGDEQGQAEMRTEFDVRAAVEIDRPPPEVWRWTAADPTLEQRWRNLDGTGVQNLERLDSGALGVGSRFRGEVKVGPGKPQAYTNEITAVETDRLISWETVAADGPLGGRGSYRLAPLDDGARTHFTIELAYPPRSLLGRLQRPVVRIVAGRMITRMLAKLKALAEGEQPGGAPT